MSHVIPSYELRRDLVARYPKAQIFVLDDNYMLPTKGMIETAYKRFQRSLWKWNVFAWLANKWDCDDFAWAFRASVSVGNALSKNEHGQPVGFLCYVDAKLGPHAINVCAYGVGTGSTLQELEPQPKHGLKHITAAERNTAWLVVI